MPGGLLTIGYGNRPIGEFLALLARHGVGRLVDVRSKPYSRAHPDYSRHRLEAHVRAAGLDYAYMGDTLGGMPERPRGREFKDALRRVALDSGSVRLALMCAELRPESCHRFRLLGRALDSLGVEVRYVDEAGGLLTHAQVLARFTGGNATLDVG